ncbi:DUF202 domain-containing protein [Corynebacterium aquatimens]|nr:DUF202 domain-containing protein [Corynebacterium aquatimens]QYH20323.1 DUF202 domain-containing protein [Corynebacterium aquatimens]
MHADPGLQPERTSMSWSRTAISMLVVSSILLRWGTCTARACWR